MPIGVYNPSLPVWQYEGTAKEITNKDKEFEKYLLNIVGTAIKTGTGKLVTCLHVVDDITDRNLRGYVLVSRKLARNTIHHTACSFDSSHALKYVRPGQRTGDGGVDLSVIPFVPRDRHGHVIDTPSIVWGDSTKLGVGDRMLIGGYPYGTDLFKIAQNNRGVVQPSFFDGIVSAIIPAQNERETRLIQLSTPAAGGMSGGAVFDPETGAAYGMITSSLEDSSGTLHPVTFAIPSEVILPYSGALNYDSELGRMGDADPMWFDEL
ncbi:MAG: serine protease [Deltaproteobacteria bacterium]|nr:serine protease [Deltaproteobacteria bacterium]